MYFNLFARSLFVGVALIFVAGNLPAATIEVPGGQATIQGAIDAANAGDTVLITDSSTYVEDVTVAKQITLEASAGQTPTIEGEVVIEDGAEGSQIGTIDGGQIQIVGTSNPQVDIDHSGSFPPVNLENLYISTTGVVLIGISGNGHVNLSHLDIDGAGEGQRGFFINPTEHGGVYSMERIRVRGYTNYGIWLYNQRGDWSSAGEDGRVEYTVNFRLSEINSPAAAQTAFLLNRNSRVTMNIEYALVRVPSRPFELDFTNSLNDVNISESVFIKLAPAETDHPVIFNENSDGSSIQIDHSDLIVLTDHPVIEATGGAENRFMSITNSNLISMTGSDGWSVSSVNTGDSFISDYNNIYTTGTTPVENVTQGPNDVVPGQDPDYFDVALGDVRYNNTFLETAGEGGTNIGVNRDHSNILTFEPPPPPNRARQWWLY